MTDWSVDERKLWPAYEDMRNGRVKAAEATLDKWAKKHPKSQPAMAMRMVISLSRGDDIVLQILKDIRQTGTLTPFSLQLVLAALRGIKRPDLTLGLLQDQWDAHPGMEELGQHVLLQAVGMRDTAKMAAASRKLFNLTKDNVRARQAAYSAWAGVVAAPTDDNPFPIAPARALLPAQLMIRTTGDDVDSGDKLWLRLQVAMGNNDHTEARRLINQHGRRGDLLRLWTAMQAAKALAERSDDADEIWTDERVSVLALLQTNPEAQSNYAFYKHAMASVKNGRDADVVAKAFARLAGEISHKERAPLLGTLELATIHPIPDKEWETVIHDYLARWGDKWSTVDELHGVEGDRGDKLRALVRASIKPHDDMRSFRALCVAELYLRKSGDKVTPSVAETTRLWAIYRDGLAYGKNVPKTDPQPADPIGFAAVEEILNLWTADRDQDHLFAAAVMLEYMLQQSPSAATARLTLVRVYRLLGAGPAVVDHMRKLKMLTEIGLDTILHIFTERGGLEAELGGYHEVWISVLHKARFMYTRSAHDLTESISAMLSNESYSKMGETYVLRDKLARSVSHRVVQFEPLMSDVFPSPTAEQIRDLLTALQDPTPWADNRSDTLLLLREPTLSAAAIRALAASAVRVLTFITGDTVQIPEQEAVSGVDGAYIAGVDMLLAAAGGDADADISNIFDALISAHSAAPEHEKLAAQLYLVQLSRVLTVVEGRALSPPRKGKKRTPAETALATGIAAARAKLAEVVRPPTGVSPFARDVALSILGKGEAEETFVGEQIKRVDKAQATLAAGIAGTLTASLKPAAAR